MDASDGVANNAGVVQWARVDRMSCEYSQPPERHDMEVVAGAQSKDNVAAWMSATALRTTRV